MTGIRRIAAILLLLVLAAPAAKSLALFALLRLEKRGRPRNAWALCIVLVPFLGGLIYLGRAALRAIVRPAPHEHGRRETCRHS
ncbi:MAG: PLD nuclease N-terminal domain-containing protein [Patescibacteria group bacterium]